MCTYTGVCVSISLKSRISIYQANKIWRTALALSLSYWTNYNKKAIWNYNKKANLMQIRTDTLLVTTKRPGTMRFSTMLVVPTWMVLCTNRQYRYSYSRSSFRPLGGPIENIS